MAVTISEDWADLLEPGLKEIFDVTVDSMEGKSMIPELYSVESSDRANEDLLEEGDMGNFEPFTGSVPYEKVQQGYKKTLTHVTYSKGLEIERELVEDDLYGKIKDKPRKLGIAAARRRESDGASLFNNAFSTVNTGGDGLALASTAHTSNVGGANQSNSGTTALSPTELETVRRAMINFKSNKDNELDVMPDTILVPLNLEQTAWEIVNSKGDPESANNTANFMYQRFRVIPWKRLTDTNNWFLIDSELAKLYLKWYNRTPVEFFKDSDFDTFIAKYAGRMRYIFGFNEWRWIYGENVS